MLPRSPTATDGAGASSPPSARPERFFGSSVKEPASVRPREAAAAASWSTPRCIPEWPAGVGIGAGDASGERAWKSKGAAWAVCASWVSYAQYTAPCGTPVTSAQARRRVCRAAARPSRLRKLFLSHDFMHPALLPGTHLQQREPLPDARNARALVASARRRQLQHLHVARLGRG